MYCDPYVRNMIGKKTWLEFFSPTFTAERPSFKLLKLPLSSFLYKKKMFRLLTIKL